MRSGAHLDALVDGVVALREELPRIERWGAGLADVLGAGGRLLAVGNGGSAAEAQHLTSELVGRFCDERRPLSALALCAESAAVSAISNDYGFAEVFARQVRAHGRPGDVLVAFSTSGASPNVLAAVEAAREGGLWSLALTGAHDCPLSAAADDVLRCAGETTATVQELHLVAIHLLCAALDRRLAAAGAVPARRLERVV